ncbi:MAG: sn-glycerol-1-phosphate dehydrogenase [Clostridia bacterium]|nr:sn-glycerol-1-phosphate dehydrogenase [Clostridia bacterium]
MEISNFKNVITGCACQKEHAAPIDKVIIEKGAVKRLPEVILGYGAKKVYLMADMNTYAAAGETCESLIKAAGIAVKPFVFPTKDIIKPDEHAVGAAVMHYDASCDIIVTVGSGVLNDVGKILATQTGKPYVIVGTAPSMDGYASTSASMELDGLKTSLNTKCADVIIGDVDILKNAPIRMLTAGLGDMIAKYISICEWRISHIVTGEYYCEYVADMVRSALKKCVDNADGLLRRDEEAVAAVFEGLVIGGVAMTYAGISRPASGVEHYFSHVYDMRGLEFGTPTDFHGIQCAIGTLIAARIYEQVKQIKPDREKALAFNAAFDYDDWKATLTEYLGTGARAMIALEAKERKYDKELHRPRLELILEHWSEILAIIDEELPSSSELESLLVRIGSPLSVSEIGLDEADLPTVFRATKDIRDKYVLSRLCHDLGIIDEIKF